MAKDVDQLYDIFVFHLQRVNFIGTSCKIQLNLNLLQEFYFSQGGAVDPILCLCPEVKG